MDGHPCPDGRLRRCRAHHSGGHLWRGLAAAVSGQRLGHAEPGRHPDQPALQRRRDPPGALYRYWRQQQPGGRLALVLIAGTLPGVIAGAVIRVELLPGPRLFDLVIAAVSLPLGAWLALTRPAPPGDPERQARPVPVPVLVALAAAVGCVGGIYGIGGGALLAPILIGLGRRPSEVAPAALAATFVTSVVGVLSFTILSAHGPGAAAPDWPTGIALGLGGLAGGYTGARLQSRLPDAMIRRLVGVVILGIGIFYLWSGLA